MSVKDSIKSLKHKKIFFGHQSVGGNIISGLSALNNELELGLHIQEILPGQFQGEGVFAHYKVGKNFDPASKNVDFMRYIDETDGVQLDYAFYKYCYVDVDSRTDIKTVFKDYLATLNTLSSRHPKIQFVACTVPLTVVQRGPKALIKKIIRRSLGGYADNQARNTFNALLRNNCKDFPIFDLAFFESIKPNSDNAHCSFHSQGKTYSALCEQYASDGRHLNLEGSKHVALKLLDFLSNIAEEK